MTLNPGQYYLVQEAGGATGAPLPTPDHVDLTPISMAAGAGKVALVNTTAPLGCNGGSTPCNATQLAQIVDLVGYGNANFFEGAAAAPTLAATTAALRTANGCTDTDNNSSDFAAMTPVPRNTTITPNTCGVSDNPPTITAPANPAATVLQDAAPFTVNLAGNDDGGVYVWSATAGAGVSSVSVTGGQGTTDVTYTVALQAGFTGTATFTAALTDNVNTPATQAVNIQVNSNVANDPPAIAPPADPITTVAQDAAPFTVSLNGVDDNGVYAWSASAGAGVANVSVTDGQGTSGVTYTVTLQAGFSGTATFTAALSDNFHAPVTQAVNITVTPAPPPPLDHVVISQVYGGGGNSGATFQSDFVELFNPDTVAHDLSGWTVQYASAAGTAWQIQPLGGTMQPGEYYLVKLATGGATGVPLPDANINGSINMSGTTGKVALVNNGDPLEGCTPTDPGVVDFVGYGGTANCREGATNAPAPSNTSAIFRRNNGLTDTNVNGNDFVTGAPNPRRTTPIVELPPTALSSDPRRNGFNAPRDASITINFTEPVDIEDGWFEINCVTSGAHDSATVAPGGATVASGGAASWIIIPNANFTPGEQCTITVNKDFVRDSDLDDAGPNTDLLTGNYTATFTVASGAAPVYPADVHLALGNPSDAQTNVEVPNNYLMSKPEFALSYNRDRGTPNWVSWHLADEWIGSLARVDTFRADPAVPAEWYRVTHVDYSFSGFDRGHMVPNADRDPGDSVPINQATFLMTNMIPQAPDNNQGPWANMENFLRTLLPANELYIVAGGAGTGGTGSNGFTETIAGGRVAVPAQTWKVALVIPKGDADLSRVTCGARTIAVIMPNTQGIRNVDWMTYLTTVDAVEQLTGYDFFENLPDAVENCVEAGINGTNPPGAAGQSVTTDEDEPVAFTLNAAGQNINALNSAILSGPTHGTLSGTGINLTYTPAANYHGPDSFTFTVSDANGSSNQATVSINVTPVNDAPTLALIGDKVVLLGDTLTFTASGSDVDGGNEMLTYVLVGTPPAGAAIDPVTGVFTWTPTAAQAGQTHTFGVRVSDALGLSDEETISVGVGYAWSGVLQPINADGNTIFKLGRVVPVRFQLTGASAGVTDAVIRLYVAKVSDSVVGTEEAAETNSHATEGNLFRYADGIYVFNLDTRGLTPGTYQLRIEMGDGVSRTVNISLR